MSDAVGLGDEIVEVTRWLDVVQLRATAVELMASWRKDLEAFVAANRQSIDGIQAVVKRQAELLKERIGEWRSMSEGGLRAQQWRQATVGRPRVASPMAVARQL